MTLPDLSAYRRSELEVRIPVEDFRRVVTDILVRYKMFEPDAQLVSQRLTDAELYGFPEFGTPQLFRILEAMDLGNLDPRAKSIAVKELTSFVVWDGGKAAGEVSATRACDFAIKAASETGIFSILIRNSQSLGTPSSYVRLAAEAGKIAFCSTSFGRPRIWPASMETATAWSFPVANEEPLIHVSSPVRSSWFELERIELYGQAISEDVLLDDSGNPVGKLDEASYLVPQSTALSDATPCIPTLLSSLLSGGKPPWTKRPAAELDGAEHYIQIIDPETLELSDYAADVADWITQAGLSGKDGLRPASIRDRFARRIREEGIGVHQSEFLRLQKLAKRFGLDLPT